MIQRADLDKKYIGTVFDRQVRIDLWNQDKLREQTVLILGIGGLGSVILMNILRLGVKKVIIIDYDIVDIHNLNRQIMYSLQDVGKSKIQSAIKNSKHHNIANTIIQGYNLDAVKNWQKIIQFVKQANIVFNCIDYGDKYDIAIASLCMKIKVPLIMGGTFATMFTIDYINYQGRACFLCLGDQGTTDKQLIEKLLPQKILQYDSLTFLPKNNNPTGRSSMLVCVTCAELMVSHYVNYLFLSQDRPYKTTRLIGYHNTFQIIKFDAQVQKKCPFCGNPNYVEPPKQQITPQNNNNVTNTQTQDKVTNNAPIQENKKQNVPQEVQKQVQKQGEIQQEKQLKKEDKAQASESNVVQ